jgi:Na+/proline symporter
MNSQFWFGLILAAALIGPLAYALLSARQISRNAYIFNDGQSGFAATLAGVVCGNMGVGTFVAIMLFSQASPVIGLSLALAYMLGLFLCAFLAPFVQRFAQQYGASGLVDLIVLAHNIKHPFGVWLPIASVFLLRAAVQLLALAALLSSIFTLSTGQAILLSTLVTGGYTAFGGYRAATRTDIFQALLIVGGMVALFLANFGTLTTPQAPFWDLGPYRWPLLVGVWLFIPVSAVLAVDNWQRMVVAKDLNVARWGFLIGAPLCGICYLIIYWLGVNSTLIGDMSGTLRALMPESAPWLADILLIAVIMSTIDTFIMPLMSGAQRSQLQVPQLRLLVAALFVFIGLLAWLLGDMLQSVIAAFSALVAFLPAVWATFFVPHKMPRTIVASLCLGVVSTFLFTMVDVNLAAFVGFVVAGLVVGIGWQAAIAQTKRSRAPQY